MEGSHIGGPFYCIGEIIGLRSFYSYFFRASERGETARIEKKTLHLEFHIQAWPVFLKEPLRCGFKRNTLCGTGAGRPPSMEETLQCASAREASDLACSHWGWGMELGCFIFVTWCFFVVLWGRILVTACWCQWACLIPPPCHGFGAWMCVL